MSIYFFYEDVTLPTLNFEFIKELFNSEIKEGKFKLGIINFIFCSDNYLLEINKKFLQHDYFTDVISFDYSESNFVSGDVYISTESVLSNSIIFNQRFTDELVRVISHGFFSFAYL